MANPHRPPLSAMLPAIIAVFAFIVSMFAGVYCHFISFPSTNGGDVTLNFGIWYYQSWSVVQNQFQGTVILESCYNYPDGTSLDAKWRSAMAFSVMVLIIGGLVTFYAGLSCCFYPSKITYQLFGMLYMLCVLFQGLTLLFIDSKACHDNSLIPTLQQQASDLGVDLTYATSCTMGAGAKCSIAATVLWFMAAIAAMKVDPPVRPPITVENQTVTYTKTTGVDGTTIVSENVVKGTPVVVGEGQQQDESCLCDTI